ncbi:HAMP domain-containing histidine kinase [Candidatus Parcubacteria bacterium]|nr:HAMP domain-containing histidine kinase [Candidatus Parcubacteria bacterium]
MISEYKKQKKISEQLNIFKQCKKYGLATWECPQFLFVVMGGIIVITAIGTYLIGTRYFDNPETVALIILGLSTVLFIISFVINHSLEKLAEASRMKSEFISIVSHQLRAPLTNLKWGIELIISEGIEDVKEENLLNFIKMLKENSARMEELINDLLIVSRMEKDGIPEKKERTDLEKIVKKFVFEFKALADASNIKVKFDCQKNLPMIYIDPSQIKLPIENFIDNAVRYTKKAGTVEVKLKQSQNNIYFEVKDQGVGIPKEDQKYIFQKFFRASNALRYQTQGSGLGLFIAKSVIDKMGGKIGFKSYEGKSSTFWFKIPIT